jgi:hypothetical protein
MARYNNPAAASVAAAATDAVVAFAPAQQSGS